MTDQPLALPRYAPCAGASRTAPMSLRKPTRGLDVRADPAPMRWAAIGIAVAFLALFIVVPLVNVFAQAFSRGLRSEEHTSELQSLRHLVCRLLLENKKIQ